MIKVDFHELGNVKDELLKFAVIVAEYENKWIYVRHRERDTWEIPGGHREKGEDINDTAKRELFEETGAKGFTIKSVGDYSVTRDNVSTYGRLFHGVVTEIGKHLKRTVKSIENKSNIEILAIGIGHDVSRYYNKAIKITDVQELGDVMIAELSGLFDNKKKLH